MALKRKRSVEELSPASSTSSAHSSSSSSSSHSVPRQTSPSPVSRHSQNGSISMATGIASPPSGDWTHAYHSGRDMHSRTRKRWRDNRPDEATIHRSTIQRLFAAQHQHQHQPQSQHHLAAGGSEASWLPPATGQKTSLHAFWDLGSSAGPPAPLLASHVQHPAAPAWRRHCCCEDCDAPLVQGQQGDRAADGDDDDEQRLDELFACRACARRVCERCALVRDARVCLDCAMLD